MPPKRDNKKSDSKWLKLLFLLSIATIVLGMQKENYYIILGGFLYGFLTILDNINW